MPHIDLIAPSGKLPDRDKIEQSLALLAQNNITAEKSSYYDSAFTGHVFFANTDAIRAEELIAAFNSDSKMIWAMRGGYGAARLLPILDQCSEWPDKILIGFSDITALSVYLWQRHGIRSLHAMVLNQLMDKKEDVTWETLLLFIRQGILPNITLSEGNDFVASVEPGVVLGGNLSVICSLLGTPYQIDTRNKILFLEDVQEAPYRVDRMLWQMHLAGKFKQIKALIFGEFTHNDTDMMNSVLHNFASALEVPVFYTKEIGHGDINLPIMQGGLYSITEQQGSFIMLPRSCKI